MKALHLYQGQINAPDQLDCMSTLRTDNSQTLVNALAEIERLKAALNKYSEDEMLLKKDADYKALLLASANQAATIAKQRIALEVALEALEQANRFVGADAPEYEWEAHIGAIATVKEALK